MMYKIGQFCVRCQKGKPDRYVSRLYGIDVCLDCHDLYFCGIEKEEDKLDRTTNYKKWLLAERGDYI